MSIAEISRDLSWPIRGQCSGQVTTLWPIRGQDGWRGGGWWRRVPRVWGQHLRGGDHQLRDLHQVRAVTWGGYLTLPLKSSLFIRPLFWPKRLKSFPRHLEEYLPKNLIKAGNNNNPFSRWFHFTCVGVDHGDACVQSEVRIWMFLIKSIQAQFTGCSLLLSELWCQRQKSQ